jgi:proline iminopeptidase
METIREGKIKIDKNGNRIFYKLYGEGEETLICLHGGPGQGYEYLSILQNICKGVKNIQVLLYDQLGSGKSDPGENVKWSIDRSVLELEEVKKYLKLGKFHLFGHSVGGMIAMQYAIDYTDNIKSLILSNTGANMCEIIAAFQELESNLSCEQYKAIIRARSGMKVDKDILEDALLDYNARYLRRETPFEINDSKKKFKELFSTARKTYGPAFEGLWGKDPYNCGCMLSTGPLLDFNVTDKLSKITVPTLILTSLYDEIPPKLHLKLAERIPNNEFVIFGNSSHFNTHEKEVNLYLAVIENFLKRMVSKKVSQHDK